MKQPKVPAGHKRQWLRCRTCHDVAYYDYVPYSFSNPITSMPCGHGLTQRDMGADRINEDEAKLAIERSAGARK